MYTLESDLTVMVITYIRKQIFSKRFLPGGKINERELARTLNISRTPIREACKELEEQGLVTSIKYKGWYVVDFSEQEAREINSIRTLLENFIFETAIREDSFTDIDLCQAELVNRELEKISKEGNSESKIYRFLEKEMEFHVALCSVAKNHCIWTQKFLKNLSYQIRLALSFVDNFQKQNFMEYSIKIHSLMLHHLKEKNLRGLEEILSRRLNRNKDL